MRTNFNLVRQFAVLSFVCIALITVVSTIVVSQFLTDKVLQRDATVSKEFIQSIVDAEGTWHLFAQEPGDTPSPELVSFSNHLAKLPDVLRANLYRVDRFVLWSSDPSLIGQLYQDNNELDRALAGRISYETGIEGKTHKQEHTNLKQGLRFVEAYLPIWNSDKSAVVGAVELYKVPTALNRTIIEGEWLVWTSAILGGIVLFAGLFWIVQRASRTMEEQQRRLIESEALTMVGETASAVAHSMRNPLAAIRASAELTLSDDLEGARESARDIIHEADRLDQWARDLLHFSNLDAGHLERIDINDVITAVLDEQDANNQRKIIEIQREFARPLPRIHANAAPIEQVLTNLVTNAVEAVGDKGVVRVKTSLDTNKRKVILTIADNGPGLSTEMTEKVFRPFFTTKSTGTGLGLPLSRRLIEGYGGTLALESAAGRGTTVTVSLPATE